MIKIVCGLATWLILLSGVCLAVEVEVLQVDADFDEKNFQRAIVLEFTTKILEELDSQVKNPDNYSVTEDIPNPDGTIVLATEKRRLFIKKIDFLFDSASNQLERNFLILELDGVGPGSGQIEIEEIKTENHTIKPASGEWVIPQPYNLSGSDFDASFSFHELTPVATFSYAYTTNFRWNNNGNQVSREWFNLEGTIPIDTPGDIKDTSGAETDASTLLADFVRASYTRRWYNGSNYQSAGLVARTTGRLNGLEVVGMYQPLATFFADGQGFLGAEAELGYREGNAEWLSRTQRAPDRGNFVGRVGAVVEWAPQIGPINRDLGSGLRFFVRGRGWADWANNEDGDGELRLRGFFDSELFYNISDDWRVFLRYETGYIPPDLSQSTESASVGVGASF